MCHVTKLTDWKVEHEVMEPMLSGDSLWYREESVTGFAYRCDGCGNCWAKRWYAETCGDRNHAASFVQRYAYKPPGYQTHGQVAWNEYERRRLGRDKRVQLPAKQEATA